MATVAFDVLGTLFSLDAPRKELQQIGAPESALELLMAQALRDYFGISHSGQYTPIKQVLESALPRMLAALGIDADQAARDQVMESFKRLEPAADARQACEAYADAGWQIMAVTNGSKKSTVSLLERAGLDDLVPEVISADQVETSKPNARVYEEAWHHAQRPLWMVASHGWDITGASHAGLRTAWVSTLEEVYLDVFPRPEIIADGLLDAAQQMIARVQDEAQTQNRPRQ